MCIYVCFYYMCVCAYDCVMWVCMHVCECVYVYVCVGYVMLVCMCVRVSKHSLECFLSSADLQKYIKHMSLYLLLFTGRP